MRPIVIGKTDETFYWLNVWQAKKKNALNWNWCDANKSYYEFYNGKNEIELLAVVIIVVVGALVFFFYFVLCEENEDDRKKVFLRPNDKIA